MKIQKVPRGLLELFKLRQTGEYPDDMGRMLTPVVDASAFYSSDTLIPASSTPSVGALNPELLETLSITATVGLLSLGGALTIGAAAATNITVSWGLILPGAPAASVLGSMFFAQSGIAFTTRFGSSFPRIVVPNGSQLFVAASGTAAGADHNLSISGLLENLSGTAG